MPRYQNQGERHKILHKLAEFQSMLNGLHDFGLDETTGIGDQWVDCLEISQQRIEEDEEIEINQDENEENVLIDEF